MIVKLLNEHHLEFLSIKGGCTGSSESILVKMPYCWKSHVAAQSSKRHTSTDHRKCESIENPRYIQGHLSRDMLFQTMWHFVKRRLRRAWTAFS